MSLFDKWLGSNDDAIKQAAILADEATTNYKNQQLSIAEYKELTSDILDYQTIVSNITDMVRKQAIYDAVNDMITVVETVTSL